MGVAEVFLVLATGHWGFSVFFGALELVGNKAAQRLAGEATLKPPRGRRKPGTLPEESETKKVIVGVEICTFEH